MRRRIQSVMREWLKSVTPAQALGVAKLAETSVPYLRHIAAGRRDMSADLAQRLAHASKEVLPLDQRDLCRACSRCPLAN